MKLLLAMALTAASLITATQVNAQQGNKVELNQLSVPANYNPNAGKPDPKPADVPTFQQNLQSQYDKSQQQVSPTIITKPPISATDVSVGVGVSIPTK